MRACRAVVVVSCFLLTVSSVGRAQTGGILRCVQPDESTGTSAAVVVGRSWLAHTTQLLPLDGRGRIVGKNDASRQIEKVLESLSAALTEGGSGLDRVAKINVYAARPDVIKTVHEAFARRFGGKAKPAVCFVITPLAHADALVGLDAVGVTARKPAGKGVARLRCASVSGPKNGSHVAILPAGGVYYISGQAKPGNLAKATRDTLQSLGETLRYLGLNRSHVVQLKSFMRPMTKVGVVEREMEEFFSGQPVPPTAYVEWKSGLPIEIELIASAEQGAAAGASESVSFITPSGMKASPVYSRLAKVNYGDRIYVSGLYGRTASDAEAQIREIFASLKSLLEQTGSDLEHMAKATYYVSDNPASSKLNEIRPEFYNPKRPPAASKAMVRGVGAVGKSITIDMIAVTRK